MSYTQSTTQHENKLNALKDTYKWASHNSHHLTSQRFIKNEQLRDKDGSVVKSTRYSCRGRRLSSKHPMVAHNSLLTSVPGYLILWSPASTRHTFGIHPYMQDTHKHKINFNNKWLNCVMSVLRKTTKKIKRNRTLYTHTKKNSSLNIYVKQKQSNVRLYIAWWYIILGKIKL